MNADWRHDDLMRLRNRKRSREHGRPRAALDLIDKEIPDKASFEIEKKTLA
jgi:hypothetical protein